MKLIEAYIAIVDREDLEGDIIDRESAFIAISKLKKLPVLDHFDMYT